MNEYEAISSVGGSRAGAPGALMVCVTGKHTCEKLLERGAHLRQPAQRLFAVHCVQTGRTFLNTAYEPLAIEYLFSLSSLFDAELTILRANNVIDALVEFAETNRVSRIVLGASPEKTGDSFVSRLSSRLPDVEFVVVD